MSNYVLFIGGTGARVYRSFLHICAAGGVREKEINVMLLDADHANQAAKASCDLYDLYQYHHDRLPPPADGDARQTARPFYCDIRMPDARAISPVQDNNVSRLEQVAKQNETRIRAMSWFYSEKERKQGLENGFYAHPNIGCVFYQDLQGSATQQFLEKITDDLKAGEEVRVVLVGSVFGGTGASGLPSIMKLLHANRGEHGENLHCCGVLVMPYFEVPVPGDEERRQNLVINSNEFYRNTRAALEYYKDHGTFERTYLVGKDKLDQVSRRYISGGPEQKNKSHIVEICAAVAVKDAFENRHRAPGVWSHMIEGTSVSWITLGEELYPVADMIRMQVVLRGSIYPYVDAMPNEISLWRPRNQWYKVYGIRSESGENLLRMKQYTNDFLRWMYDVQTEYGADMRIPDESVQLCETLVTEFEGYLGLGGGGDPSPKEERSAMEQFNNLIDTAANIEYVFDKIILILSCLGVVKSSLAGHGCFGLLIKLFEIAGQKREKRRLANR